VQTILPSERGELQKKAKRVSLLAQNKHRKKLCVGMGSAGGCFPSLLSLIPTTFFGELVGAELQREREISFASGLCINGLNYH